MLHNELYYAMGMHFLNSIYLPFINESALSPKLAKVFQPEEYLLEYGIANRQTSNGTGGQLPFNFFAFLHISRNVVGVRFPDFR